MGELSIVGLAEGVVRAHGWVWVHDRVCVHRRELSPHGGREVDHYYPVADAVVRRAAWRQCLSLNPTKELVDAVVDAIGAVCAEVTPSGGFTVDPDGVRFEAWDVGDVS